VSTVVRLRPAEVGHLLSSIRSQGGHVLAARSVRDDTGAEREIRLASRTEEVSEASSGSGWTGERSAVSGVEEALRQAALDLFVERGFHGTSMREIAALAGTGVSHVYYYFPSKAHVLKSMMVLIVTDLLTELAQAVEEAPDDPGERLQAIVKAQVLFHSQRQAEAFVARSELRSLRPEDRPEVIGLYDRVTQYFRSTIAEGIKRGVFRCAYEAEATSALVTMCNGVSSWYRKGGPLSPAQIAERYAELALSLVGSVTAGQETSAGRKSPAQQEAKAGRSPRPKVPARRSAARSN
jgi:AcrR family transcriptional regulator